MCSNLRITLSTHRRPLATAGHTVILWGLVSSNTSLENNFLPAILVTEAWVTPTLLITIIDVIDTFIFSLNMHLLRLTRDRQCFFSILCQTLTWDTCNFTNASTLPTNSHPGQWPMLCPHCQYSAYSDVLILDSLTGEKWELIFQFLESKVEPVCVFL